MNVLSAFDGCARSIGHTTDGPKAFRKIKLAEARDYGFLPAGYIGRSSMTAG